MHIKKTSGYFGVWLSVILLSLMGSYINAVLLGVPFQLRQELPFMARWLVWIPMTPLAIHLAGKLNYSGNSVRNFFAYHFAIYLVLCAIHIFAASLTAKVIAGMLGSPVPYDVILRKCALTGVFFNFIVYVMLLLVINGVRYYQALQAEKLKIIMLEKSLSESRLMFLKQQLQPHFLFNTHHSIITLIKMGEKEKAASMLEQLSDLMRVALREADEQKVTLEKEIETLQLYVAIQKTRFEDKMDVLYSIDDDTRAAYVPSMILQPIVENSIKYAVERSTSNSMITVEATRLDASLTLKIKDVCNNRGPNIEIKKGTGLLNSEERVRKLYGAAGSLSIGPYQNDDNEGMEVTITIPLQYAAN